MSPLAWRLFELSQLRGIGPKTLRALAGRKDLGSASEEDLRYMDARLARALKEPGAFEKAQSVAEQQLEQADRQDAFILSSVDSDFPALLLKTDDAPMFLYVRGGLDRLAEKAISVIGSREPTPHGILIAERLTRHFAEQGWSIVSGLALGCDAAAHRAALSAGGKTVAVLAHGLQTVAPLQHAELAEQIVATGGTLVTEYAYGVEAAPPLFVRRDRIQAGLSKGVVMIQSDLEGGSLHASRAALRYGRLLAVPRPTSADIDAASPEIKANVLLADGSDEEKMKLLQCDASALSRVRVLESREDYDVWERELEAVGRRGSV
jgi:DNA processing protein